MIVRVGVVALLTATLFVQAFVIVGLSGRLVIITILILLLSFAIGPRGPQGGPLGLGALIAISVTLIGTVVATTFGGNGPSGSSNLQRFLVSYPLAFVAGAAACATTEMRRLFSRAYSIVGGMTAVLACIEVIVGRSLVGRQEAFDWLVRDGSARALLGSEHSLVLGVMIAAAIPCALVSFHGSKKWLLTLVLLLGVWSTDSRGALGLSVVFIIALGSPRFSRHVSSKGRGALVAALVLGLAALTYFATNVWRPETYSADWSENSLEYRAALYALLPNILLSAPFGYGLIDLPSGVWQVLGPRRVIDVTRSVDSQLVLSALRTGWLGVVVFVFMLVLGIRALKRSPDIAGAFLLVTAAGGFVALDAWDGLGVLWAFLFGICVRLVLARQIDSASSDLVGDVSHPNGRPGHSSGGILPSHDTSAGFARRPRPIDTNR